jgi:ribosome modulation factor
MEAAMAEISSQQAYEEGTAAFHAGKSREDCPYQKDTAAGAEWMSGFEDAANGTEALSPDEEE